MHGVNWLQHPVALAARRFVGRTPAIGAVYTADDGQQIGAIRAWMASEKGADLTGAVAVAAGRRAVIDGLRTTVHDPRNGNLPMQYGDDSREQTYDITPERILSAKQALRRLLAMPQVWQRVALGVLEGESYEAIGLSLDQPITASRVCQIVGQIRRFVDEGSVPSRPQLAETPDTNARPYPHSVRALHALDAVHSRSALQDAIHDPAIGEVHAAAAVQAAAAAALYRSAMGD
jgi:hypothetical protein